MTSPTDDRRRLADLLRGLRDDADVSTTELARRLGWSQSKVSKTERGITLPSPPDIGAWASALHAPARLHAELAELAGRATEVFAERRRVLAPGPRRAQREIQHLEEEVSVVRVYNPTIVVGLAQTRAYVEAMFRLGPRRTREEDLDAAVESRLARQQALVTPGRRFELLMGEAALRRRLLDDRGMRDQLEHLIGLSVLDNVRLGVIRFDARETVHQRHGYSIMGDPDLDDDYLTWVATETRTLRVRDESEVREYLAHFAALTAAATSGDELRALLTDLLAGTPRP